MDQPDGRGILRRLVPSLHNSCMGKERENGVMARNRGEGSGLRGFSLSTFSAVGILGRLTVDNSLLHSLTY